MCAVGDLTGLERLDWWLNAQRGKRRWQEDGRTTRWDRTDSHCHRLPERAACASNEPEAWDVRLTKEEADDI